MRTLAGGGRAQQSFQVLAEAHVEHLVGLVEHRHAHASQRERAAREQVHEPPGRADHQIHPAVEQLQVAPDFAAPGERGNLKRRLGEQPAQLGTNLLGQLAGGRDDEARRIARLLALGRAAGRGGLAKQCLRQQHAEGQGLARAGLRRDQQIVVLASLFEYSHLNGRRRFVPARGDGVGERRGDVERGKQGHQARSYSTPGPGTQGFPRSARRTCAAGRLFCHD